MPGRLKAWLRIIANVACIPNLKSHECFILCIKYYFVTYIEYNFVQLLFSLIFLFAELLGDILKQKPSETDGVESVIVVDGVPQVEPERLEKLQSVISKVLGKFGTIVNQYYPKNENGYTKGCVLMTYILSLYLRNYSNVIVLTIYFSFQVHISRI